jgi:hypothetical protein
MTFGGSNCFGAGDQSSVKAERQYSSEQRMGKMKITLTIYETSFHTPCTENNF